LSIRFRLKPENSNSHRFELHRSSIKGAKLILKGIKAIIIILRLSFLHCLYLGRRHLTPIVLVSMVDLPLGPGAPRRKEWKERAKGKKDWWRARQRSSCTEVFASTLIITTCCKGRVSLYFIEVFPCFL